MAKYNNQKAKILFLQQMLGATDREHAISMQEILEKLSEKGIRAERKSIYDDMEVLRYFGMNIEYRRERPTGYYLAGGTPSASSEYTEAEAAEPQSKASKAADTMPEKKPTPEAWMQYLPGADSDKTIKLLCSEEGKDKIVQYFGSAAQCRQREEGEYQATVPYLDTPEFYGWLTAVAADVRLQKPKKIVQEYRDYLKMIAKSYKNGSRA